MGILFDSVQAGKGALFLNGEKVAEIPAGEATMIAQEERSITVGGHPSSIWYLPGVYMREEPVRPDRKEQSDHESQD